MGSLIGHVAPGFCVLIVGLWHLLNHIKLHVQNPKTYHSLPWFASSEIRHLELILIITSSSTAIAMELFILPRHHHPLDTDNTIPCNHLHNFEHSIIEFTFLVYAAFAIILDKFVPKARYELTQLLASVAFVQELILFHFHSTDHMGVEGQYHMFLQILILVSLVTNVLGIGYPKSFMLGFTRSVSVFFQGLWLMVTGVMLWTRILIPEGCFLNFQDGHYIVGCDGNEALERAKSLANVQFCWCLICVTIFAMTLYIAMHKIHEGKSVEYRSPSSYNDEELGHQDIESHK